ncbi:TonB-dependent hemoglobin/transferrin/lactoferrin family receptor [Amorphus orientalis]|uniref:Hemoglobin/transferrin/lactoferrin receptor protein n=1 Tax=Amorphus orientalis TaxID=649198 RepID=A0AAE4AUA4_9HYPH|nr:TonB-dependent hemoglobin/transferrin/lactoferrin family receptor [Amorphus orientalis]MDQ0316917.1 hemoglobin/transferrin/lactoferrin receptor protein [Amorphus orientalis]
MTYGVSRTALLASASALLMTQAAVAQDAAPQNAVELDTILVSSTTSTRTGQVATDSLSGSTVVTGDIIKDEFASNRISDVLDTMPGVWTDENADDPATAINIRGLQDFGRVNVMIDGARQNFQRTGHNANGMFYVDPEMIRAIDVTRGPTSTIYGSGAIGGVVDFRTLTADDVLRGDENVAGRLKGRLESNSSGGNGHAEAAARVGNAFDVIAAGTWGDWGAYTDGHGDEIPNSGYDLKSGLFKARVRPAYGHEITASALLYNATYDQGTATVYDTDTWADTYRLNYRYQRPEDRIFDLSAQVYYTSTKTDQTITAVPNYFPRPSLGSTRTFEIETTGVDVFNTSRVALGATEHALTYGFDAFRDQVSTSDPDPFGSGDEFTPPGKRNVYGGYLQDQMTVGMLDVIAALRYDGYDLDGQGTSSSGEHLSPRITVGITPVDWITIFGTYAEAYRAPSLTETTWTGTHPPVGGAPPFEFLPNANLDPETAHNVEGGINFRFDDVVQSGDRFRARVMGYYNQVDDYIGTVVLPFSFRPGAVCSSPPFCYQYQNISQANLWGFEAGMDYDAGRWFAGLSGTIARGVDAETGDNLDTIPPDRLTLTGGFRALQQHLTAGGRLNLVAAQEKVSADLQTDAYATLDLFASYEVKDGVSVGLNIDNVFDTYYEPFLDAEAAPGLNAKLTLDLRLGGKLN